MHLGFRLFWGEQMARAESPQRDTNLQGMHLGFRFFWGEQMARAESPFERHQPAGYAPWVPALLGGADGEEEEEEEKEEGFWG